MKIIKKLFHIINMGLSNIINMDINYNPETEIYHNLRKKYHKLAVFSRKAQMIDCNSCQNHCQPGTLEEDKICKLSSIHRLGNIQISDC